MEFTIRYDEEILRHAVNTFMKRRLGEGLGWLGLVAVAMVCVSMAVLLWLGDRSWAVGAIGITLLVFVIVIVAIWIWRRQEMRAKLAAIPNRSGVVMVNDDTLSIALHSATTTMPWSSITEVWKLKDCWLLFLAPNNFVTLPTAGVPAEALEFMANHLPAPSFAIPLK